MQGGAVTLAETGARAAMDGWTPDLIVATDMVNLPAFLALTRDRFARVPVLLYLHENQLTYPLPRRRAAAGPHVRLHQRAVDDRGRPRRLQLTVPPRRVLRGAARPPAALPGLHARRAPAGPARQVVRAPPRPGPRGARRGPAGRRGAARARSPAHRSSSGTTAGSTTRTPRPSSASSTASTTSARASASSSPARRSPRRRPPSTRASAATRTACCTTASPSRLSDYAALLWRSDIVVSTSPARVLRPLDARGDPLRLPPAPAGPPHVPRADPGRAPPPAPPRARPLRRRGRPLRDAPPPPRRPRPAAAARRAPARPGRPRLARPRRRLRRPVRGDGNRRDTGMGTKCGDVVASRSSSRRSAASHHLPVPHRLLARRRRARSACRWRRRLSP